MLKTAKAINHCLQICKLWVLIRSNNCSQVTQNHNANQLSRQTKIISKKSLRSGENLVKTVFIIKGSPSDTSAKMITSHYAVNALYCIRSMTLLKPITRQQVRFGYSWILVWIVLKVRWSCIRMCYRKVIKNWRKWIKISVDNFISWVRFLER